MLYHTLPFHPTTEYDMKTNIGGIDRIARIAAGLALIGMTLVGVIGLWGWIGVVPLLTGVCKFCPVYAVFGIRSCPMEKE